MVKSSIQTVERSGVLNQLSGRGNDVANQSNQSGIISVVSNIIIVYPIILHLTLVSMAELRVKEI